VTDVGVFDICPTAVVTKPPDRVITKDAERPPAKARGRSRCTDTSSAAAWQATNAPYQAGVSVSSALLANSTASGVAVTMGDDGVPSHVGCGAWDAVLLQNTRLRNCPRRRGQKATRRRVPDHTYNARSGRLQWHPGQPEGRPNRVWSSSGSGRSRVAPGRAWPPFPTPPTAPLGGLAPGAMSQ
jgi:hypothetical protein